MTILVALKDEKNKRVIIGSDKQTTCGQMIHRTKEKIVCLLVDIVDDYGKKTNECKIYIALCGYAFMRTFVQYGFEVPEMCEGENFVSYLYNKFFKKLRDGLMNNNLVKVHDSLIDTESNMIIVHNGDIYLIGVNLCVDVLDNEFYVDGSGWQVATGSLYTNLKYHSDLDKRIMVEQAIYAAGENTIYCNSDIQIMEAKY